MPHPVDAPALRVNSAAPALCAPAPSAPAPLPPDAAPDEPPRVAPVVIEVPAPLVAVPAAPAAAPVPTRSEPPTQLTLLPEPALIPSRRADPATRLIAAADALSAAMRELYRLDASNHPALTGAEAALEQGERVARALWKIAVKLDPSLSAQRAEG